MAGQVKTPGRVAAKTAGKRSRGKGLSRRVAVSRAQDSSPATQGPACHGVFCYDYDPSIQHPELGRRKPLRIAVTGAAGHIANHLLFKIGAGEVFGKEQPVELFMLASEKSYEACEGVAMELEDSIFPQMRRIAISTDPEAIFDNADWALLLGARPRKQGEERSDLLQANGEVFQRQGRALDAAKEDTTVVVVGNPCNTNALIASENCSKIAKSNFHALTRLDENRAKCQLAMRAGVHYESVSNVTIWGNHSATQVPDFVNARISGKPAVDVIDEEWLKSDFTPKIQNRGAAVIKKWGRSSGASTAVSIAHTMRSLAFPTPGRNWFSSAVRTDGNPYGVPEGLVYSCPIRSDGDGHWHFVPKEELIFDDWLCDRMNKSADELNSERQCVNHLIGSDPAACDLSHGETLLPGEEQTPV